MDGNKKESASVGTGMAAVGAVLIGSALLGVPIVTFETFRNFFGGSSSSK